MGIEKSAVNGIRLARRIWRGLGVLLVLTMAGAPRLLAQQTTTAPAPSAAPLPANAAPAGRRVPRPKTPEESAAYRKFMTEQRPDEQIRLVEDFLLQFPESELKEYAFQAAMQAYQTRNDLNRMLTYGELTLGQNPDNLSALLTLSNALAETTDRNDPDRNEKLDDGDQYAAHAIEVLSKLPRPPAIPEQEWAEMKKDSTATAHASRGLIGLIRADFAKAEAELQQAVALTAKPDAVLLYRLGLSYSFLKKYDQALEVLQRAATLGGVKVAAAGGKIRDLVAEAKEFATKGRAASGPPVAEAPAEPPEASAPPPPDQAP